MWTDDISFCPIEKCRRKACPRNQMNIRDRTIPHSYFVERPPDCPYRKKQDDFYHIRQKGGVTKPDRKKIIGHLNDCMEASRRDNTWVFVRKDIVEDALALLKEQDNCENCAIAIEDRQPVVRCKDCKHRGNSEKCVLSAISEEKNFPLFILDNRGEWYCADGERRGD